jgi:hypothetical protein
LSLFYLFFFSYGHAMDILEQHFSFEKHTTQSLDLLFFILPIFLFLLLILIRIKKNFAGISKLISIITCCGIVTLTVQIVYFEISNHSFPAIPSGAKNELQPAPAQCKNDACRDIYYIIVEKYGSQKILNDYFHFDNSPFITYLKKQGFYVADGSLSNYLSTPLSLASSLNFTYLNDLSKQVGENYKNRAPLYKMLIDYRVWRFLKSVGYSFIHVGPYWDIDIQNKFADKNYSYQMFGMSDFTRIYLETTLLYPIMSSLNINNPFGLRVIHYNFSLDQINALENFSKDKSPKFIFAHLYITHDPWVFDENGGFVSQQKYDALGYKTGYINTLKYANTKLETMIETIFKNSKKPPIIILQGDEGPRTENFYTNQNIPWTQATDEDFIVKTGILNAYYFPDMAQNVLYPSITPVNSFRVLFNTYFGQHFDLLPDKVYAHPEYLHPYKYWDITSKVQL